MKKVIEANRVVFSFLAAFAFLATLIETYSYVGFLRKFLFVDSRFFLALALVSAFLLRQVSIKGGLFELLNTLVFKINRLILPLSLVVYLVMQILEAGKFHNYVFSVVHLQPGNFFYLVILSGGLYIIDKMRKNTFEVNGILNLGIALTVGFIFAENFNLTVHQAIGSDLYIALHPLATYDQKMQNYWGFYYDYMVFVKSSTPENSTIMIPPMESPWLSTGNGALDLYFLYPRKLVQGTNEKSLDVKSIDYVLLAWGEWQDSDVSKYGWPKAKINPENINYLNGSKDWGVIKVKK